MKHLIDEREPITMADIDAAVSDADRLLESPRRDGVMPPEALGVLERLRAIVAYTYGPPEAGTYRPRPTWVDAR